MNGVSRFTGGRRVGQGASFSVLVFANVLLMASTSAPSPIYPLYLQRWGFSVTTLTVVFAVYVAGLAGALLTVGSLSDHLGRRPVLVASLLVAAAGTRSSGRPAGSSRSCSPLLRNRSAFGFMHWERIWERNAAQRARSRGMRRDGLDGREVVTCRSETREATGDGDRLAHNPEVASTEYA